MHAIILAAGEGIRLRPHTDARPKCLVPLAGKELLNHQLSVLQKCGVEDVTVVTGYRGSQIAELGLKVVDNPAYESTNMLASLGCASELFDGSKDLVVTYGDIVYEARVLKSLMSCFAPLAITVDKNWHDLWSARMPDPLADAETLRLDADERVIEIGQRPTSPANVEGQYMGLIKIAAGFVKQFASLMESLKSGEKVKGRTWATMDMTTFLQHLIDSGFPVQAVGVYGGWLEVDSTADLEVYQQLYRDELLEQFWRPEAA
jgi:choline kinase